MVDAAQGSMLFGLFMVTAAWLAGPARWAAAVRRFAAPALREHAGLVRAGLGVLILLLVIWGPVPWTTKPIPVLVFTAAAFLWLEWIRSRTLAEVTGDATPREPTTPQEVPGV
jgi:cobalamin synthase